MVEGLYSMMHSNGLGPINLGNPNEMSVLELAKKIKSMTDSSSKITFAPLPKDDPEKRKPDISKAHELLGWKPVVSLDEGLKKTIESMKKN
jgi:nucleoside-diphosphate-sugar epimerase